MFSSNSLFQKLSAAFGAVEKIAVSPDSKKIALFNDRGILSVASVSLKTAYWEWDSKKNSPPSEIMWCGNDAVLLCWSHAKSQDILLVQQNAFKSYDYDDNLVQLVQECDGIRIITNETCEFLQKVPECARIIFEIGSVSPAALLYDATEAFENRQAKADENIRSIQSAEDLKNAILACVPIFIYIYIFFSEYH